MTRWLRIAGIGLGVLVLLLLLLAGGVLFTAPGARIVLDRVLPGEAEVGAVAGSLWGPLVLEDVRYTTPAVEARIARVRLAWRPTRLLRRTLDITALEVDTVRVRLRETEDRADKEEDGGFTRPSMPLAVRLEELVSRQLSVVTAGGDTVRVGTVALAGGARHDTFALDSLRVRDFDYRGGRFQADAGGTVITGATGARDSADLALEWSGRLADGRAVAGVGRVEGAAGALVVETRLAEPVVATLDGRVDVPWAPDSLRWSLALEVPRVDLSRLRDGLPGGVALAATASGDLATARAEITGSGEHPAVGPVALDARGRYGDGSVTLDTLRLRRLAGPAAVTAAGSIDLGDDGPVLGARLAWTELGWPLDSAAVASPSGTVRIEGWLEGFRADGDVALRRQGQPLGRWAVAADGSYADGRLRLPEVVARREGGGRVALTADVDLEGGPRGEAVLEWAGLTWPPAPGDTTRLASRDGRLRVQGAPEDFTVAADLAVSGPAVPVDRVRLDLRGDADSAAVNGRLRATGTVGDRTVLELDGRAAYRLADRLLRVDTLDARLPETGGRLGLRGELDLSGPEPRVAGRARWQALGWPVHEPRYRSAEGRIDVATRGGEVRLTAEGRLGGATLPDGRWRLAGHGGLDRFVVDSLRGSTLGGEVRAAGVIRPVRPDSGPAWDLRVAGDTLDPGLWRDPWNGRVGFRLRTEGRLAEAGPTFRLVLDSVHGQVRDRPVSARAVAEGVDGRVTVDTLWLRSGESTLEAAGTVGDSVDVGWRLAAASLYDFVPQAAGALQATGRIIGPRTAPSVALEAEGQGVTVAGWAADSLSAVADIAPGGRGSSAASITLTGVRGASFALDSLALDVDGTRADHVALLRVVSPDDVLEGRLAGGLDEGRWAGRLDRFRLQSDLAGSWELRDTARLAVGADSGAVEGLCWVGTGEVCVTASWGSGGVRWDGSGQALPLAFLRPVLPQGLQIRGELALETRGRTGGGPVPTGMLRLTGGPGEIDYASDIGRGVTRPYESVTLEAESDSSGLDGRVELRLGALGQLQARAALPGAGPLSERGLAGEVTLQLEDDGTVSRLVPTLTESHGNVELQVELAGSVAAPAFRGRATIRDAGAVVTPAGVRLSDGSLTAASTDGGRWEIEGGVRSDTSRLSLRGFVRPPGPDSAWLAAVTVEGEAVPTVQTPELVVISSPRLELRASADSVVVDGHIVVPRARIAIRELEGNAEVSPDVVVVGVDGEVEPDSVRTPTAVRAEVELVLGDDVRIDAFGLTGRLDGQLAISARADRTPVGNGELEIVDGEYRIYRQTFQIDQGQLLFASTPLTDPGLDLRVTRGSGQITAGMDITGRASDPRVRLFSDPSLADEQILAYLIAGRPLRSLSRSEGSRVQGMARSIGVAGGNLLLARLGSAFGLETARIERTDPDEEGARQTRLVLGSEVLPRVHVDYAIGLRGAANVVRLRYMITDHWIFQTESGEETGADLLYTFGSPIPPVDRPPTSTPPQP